MDVSNDGPGDAQGEPFSEDPGPVYEREIIFRGPQGPHGWMLQDIAAPDAAMARINLAIR